MIFCDFDEYLFCKNETLYTYIKKNKNIDTFAFKQILSKTDEKVYTFPNVFYVSDEKFEYINLEYSLKYNVRPSSKCIHKLDTLKTISQHYCDDDTRTIDSSNYFYHFFNWTQLNRKKPGTFKLLKL